MLNGAKVVSIEQVSATWHLLSLEAVKVARYKPGQFIHLRLSGNSDPLLRRPFSIHNYLEEKNTLQILFQQTGRGTAIMTNFIKGYELDFIGPLGNGFHIEGKGKKVALVAGGIGMAPLFFLAKDLQKRAVEFDFFLGSASAETIPKPGYFLDDNIEPIIATEDGSFGFKGKVTELIKSFYGEEYSIDGVSMICSCGPLPMLKSLFTGAKETGIPLQVSLEERMACAVGACLGCACKVRDKEKGTVDYQRVCKEGPVFSGEAVFF